MTVRILKEILDGFDDDVRVIIDNGHYNADPRNEIILAFKMLNGNSVVLQTRDDFDVSNELEATLEHYAKEDMDECDAMMELMEMGFTLDDFRYDDNRYEWAKRVANEYGLI